MDLISIQTINVVKTHQNEVTAESSRRREAVIVLALLNFLLSESPPTNLKLKPLLNISTGQ